MTRPKQPAFTHPAWCSQGSCCQPPRRCRDDSVDWSHARMDVVDGKDLHGDVFLVHMHEISAEGVLRTDEAIVITADGSFTADQAEAFAQACLTAARLLRAGLVEPDTKEQR